MNREQSIRQNSNAAIALIRALQREPNSDLPVIYTDDSGKEHQTNTASDPWQLGHGQWVIKLEGRAGGIDCSRVRATTATPQP